MKIGNLKIETPIALAPMEAINCKGFRMLSRYLGAGLVYTAMIDAEDFLNRLHLNRKEVVDFYLDIDESEKPVAVQIVGNDPKTLEKAAKVIEPYADIIDINFGCIEGDILGRKMGAYYVKHPDQIEKLVSPLLRSIKKPVTAKIRIGWDKDNAVEIAKILEKLGFKAIAVHGRTRKQKYTGKADWEVIKKVKEAVHIPIIGNGDINKAGQAKYYLERGYCDAIMIGRAAKTNPFIFKQCKEAIKSKRVSKYTEKDFEKMKDMFRRFYEMQIYQRKGELKDHMAWFKKGWNFANAKDYVSPRNAKKKR